MVDAIVSSAVQRLGDFLIQEKEILQDVADKVKKLIEELGSMQCFIEDAERKQDGVNKTVIRQWIADLRDVAYKVEDVIDDFVLKVKVEEGDLPNIGEEIEALKNTVVNISVRKDAYDIRDIRKDGEQMDGATGNLRQRRRTFSLEDEDEHVVGFEKVADSLVKDELLKDDPWRCVISIVGMGGLGKTTLARKLYHHSKIKENFHHRAWVCVTENYRFRDVLQTIGESLKLSSKEMTNKNEEELRQYLRENLNERRYLVVIDDIWHEKDWHRLSSAFPNNNKGSRVIITSRNEVATCADKRTCVHKLQKLDKDATWKLFCMKAFRDESCCPPDLETLGRRMVEKCDGLPLAIIVLGGLLNNTLPEEWPRVEKTMWQHLRDNSLDIDPLLSLSFNDLPKQMKPCFLYFGLFPEDFVIDTEKLIHLWVAEGFIPPEKNQIPIKKQELISSWIFEGLIPEKNQTMEEVAWVFLNELISRNFVQVAKRNWQKITACRVHDLLRDLAVKRAKGLNFLHIHEHNNDSTPSSSIESSYRRQAAYPGIGRYFSVDYSNPFLRSLLFFNGDLGRRNFEWLQSIQEKFKLLRVLDLQNIKFFITLDEGSLLEAIGGLIYLRYLGLRNTNINELPSSIINLQALQTLDVFNNTTVRLLGDICKLKQLRHLIGNFGENLRVDGLTNLQTLVFISIRDWINTDPVRLINLRELNVVPSTARVNQIKFTLDTVGKLPNLQSLSVRLDSPMCFSSFEPLSDCCYLLQLMLYGKIEKLPEQMHEYLPSLEYLQLRRSELLEDPMPALEKLPNLKILELLNNNFEKLTATANGFRRLEVLRLLFLSNLKEFQLDDGSMPRLKFVTIYNCKQLTPIPEKLKLTPQATNLNWDWSDRYT